MVVMRPFKKPRRAPAPRVINPARNRLIPVSNNLMKIKEQNTSIEPTERSNSPETINIPTPKAIILNSGASARRTLMLATLLKRYLEKNVNSIIKPINTRKILED